ncbi:MAG TPA: hypothetical protein VKV31_01735 [bacterium]|nr:hypothetical protein [bacterium]
MLDAQLVESSRVGQEVMLSVGSAFASPAEFRKDWRRRAPVGDLVLGVHIEAGIG